MTCSVGAVVLASGESKRFDGGCKLLAPFPDQPLLTRVLEALPPALFVRRLVVTRRPDIQRLALDWGFEALLHDLPDISDTVRLGVSAMTGLDGCLFAVGDQPLLTAETTGRLVRAFQAHPERIVRAYADGVPGNPVLFPKACYAALAALPPGKGGGYLIKNASWEAFPVEVGDPRELWDVDTRPEYEAALAAVTKERRI